MPVGARVQSVNKLVALPCQQNERPPGTIVLFQSSSSANRNAAVHPADRPLLGMKWRRQYYVDMALPFGLWSAPFVFTAIADLVEWTHGP